MKEDLFLNTTPITLIRKKNCNVYIYKKLFDLKNLRMLKVEQWYRQTSWIFFNSSVIAAMILFYILNISRKIEKKKLNINVA